jgi:hypothetical protein
MHQQVKTSPHDARGNLTAVVEALAAHDINIEAIAPDFESPHIRTVVDHGQEGAAMEALLDAGLEPILLKAVAFDLNNTHGQLDGVLKQLRNRGYEIDSLLIGGTHGQGNRVRVSIGIKEPPDAGWEAEAEQLAEEILASL